MLGVKVPFRGRAPRHDGAVRQCVCNGILRRTEHRRQAPERLMRRDFGPLVCVRCKVYVPEVDDGSDDAEQVLDLRLLARGKAEKQWLCIMAPAD